MKNVKREKKNKYSEDSKGIKLKWDSKLKKKYRGESRVKRERKGSKPKHRTVYRIMKQNKKQKIYEKEVMKHRNMVLKLIECK